MTKDLPALWSSDAWRADAAAWVEECVSDAGRVLTGPVEVSRIRFWSVVLRAETDRGAVWFKENAPSQAFESGLMAALHELTPGRVPPVLGADPGRGRLLTEDVGLPLAADPLLADDTVALDAVVDLASTYSDLQRTLAANPSVRHTARVPAFPGSGAVSYAARLAEQLAALPTGDKRRLDVAGHRVVADGLQRLADAAARLDASGIPDSLEHNDLHLWNAFRAPGGGTAFLDLGDAVWAHPFASLRILSWVLRARIGFPPGTPEHDRLVDAYLEPWTDLGTRTELRDLLPAAERLSCLHRAESWRRLQADVPLACIDEEWLDAQASWLTAACAPDPFEATRN